MPAVNFAFHKCASHAVRGGKVCQPCPDGSNGIEVGIKGCARCIFEAERLSDGGNLNGDTIHNEPADAGTNFHDHEAFQNTEALKTGIELDVFTSIGRERILRLYSRQKPALPNEECASFAIS